LALSPSAATNRRIWLLVSKPEITPLLILNQLCDTTKGAALASLISDVVPTSAQQAMEKSVEMLAEKFATMEDRINTETVNKDEFADLCKGFLRVVANTNREEKLRAAANILANSLLPPGDPARSTYEELDHLMHCLDSLSIGAIAVLGAARQISLAYSSSNGAFHFPELRNKFQSDSLQKEPRRCRVWRVRSSMRVPAHSWFRTGRSHRMRPSN
jgi:hypothetical protein